MTTTDSKPESLRFSSNRRKKIALRLFFIGYALLCRPIPAFCESPIERWRALVVVGTQNESKANYKGAIAAFGAAVNLAETYSMPSKYLGIALSRQVGAEVASDHVVEAEPHFQRLMKLALNQKKNGALDSEEILWMVDVADAYLAHQNPKTRESCIKNTCSLKEVTYGREHIEYSKAMLMLAKFYLEHQQLDKALKILNELQSLQTWVSGKPADPSLLGNFLYQSALDFSTSRNYKASDAIAQQLVNMASSKTPTLQSGRPAFYSLLGINALSQGKTFEANQRFTQAIKDCKRVSAPGQIQAARMFLEALIRPVRSEIDEKRYSLAETILKHLLKVQELMFNDPSSQYGFYNLLSIVISEQGKANEAEKCLQKAIAIAQLPNSYNRKDLAELYLRLGSWTAVSDMNKASDAFSKALTAESEKIGFHSTLVLLHWGCRFREHGQLTEATKKLSLAQSYAGSLAPQKRGTLLADALFVLAAIDRSEKRQTEAESFEKQSSAEIELQKQLNSKLGPDFFHRL